MIVRAARVDGPIVLFLILGLCGCTYLQDGPENEERDSHYLRAKKRQSEMDYPGAVASYEKALEANPRSSVAHLDLGLLYAEELHRGQTTPDEKRRYHAMAIYHLEKYLALKPDDFRAESLRGRISASALELAKTVSFTLLESTAQNEIERLHATNRSLLRQVTELQLRLAQQGHTFSNQLQALHLEYRRMPPPGAGSQAVSPVATPVETPRASSVPPATRTGRTEGGVRPVLPDTTPRVPAPASPRTNVTPLPTAEPRHRIHIIRTGDTFAALSRRYGTSTAEIQGANPGVDPVRLKSGQAVRIPVR